MLSPERSLALLLALSLVTVGGYLAVDQQTRASGYATTNGTVRSVELDRYRRIGRPNLFGNTYYDPNVTYTYVVDGRRYIGHDVSLGSDVETNQRRRAEAVVAALRDADRVTVHYDPAHPDRAYLLTRYDFFPPYALVAAGLLLAADTATPGTRWLGFVLSRLPGGRERTPWSGGDDASGRTVPDDPSAVLEGQRDSAGDEDDALVSGRRAWAVWVAFGVASLSLVAHYLLVSRPPYDVTAYAAVLAVAAGVVRVVSLRRSG